MTDSLSRAIEEGGRLQAQIDYDTRFHVTPDDYTSGFSARESGECCDKCRMEPQHMDGRADALKAIVGCRDPFQINCRCHIGTRKAVVAERVRLLRELRAMLTALVEEMGEK